MKSSTPQGFYTLSLQSAVQLQTKFEVWREKKSHLAAPVHTSSISATVSFRWVHRSVSSRLLLEHLRKEVIIKMVTFVPRS